jgi:hypothetical protein
MFFSPFGMALDSNQFLITSVLFDAGISIPAAARNIKRNITGARDMPLHFTKKTAPADSPRETKTLTCILSAD